MMRYLTIIVFSVTFLLQVKATVKIPENISKPWTYWWWMGNSVTRQGITDNLETMHSAGIGGVHIIPIYGEKGDESNYLGFLSPEWMQMLEHTTNEASRLGMGVDMTTGTGWPFGGPYVTADDAAKRFFIRTVPVRNRDVNINDCLKNNEEGILLSLAAYDSKGNYSDLTSRVDQNGVIIAGKLNRHTRIYAMFRALTQQKVKRAAPGGEGLVIDYFSRNSILNYMKRFEDAFSPAGISGGKVRAFYNDSYEVYGANWTDNFFNEFLMRRGYDLRPYIRHLADTSVCEIRQRVITDYCATVADLLHDEFTVNWVNESHKMGSVTRYQAHGSPGNLLDLYAMADIPETESFGASGFSIPGLRRDPDYQESNFGKPDPLVMKFASSAANVKGKELVSSESTTWLGDHFKVSLSQIKPQIDELFVSGINHIFFHGSTYSPREKPFPGRLFYASTNYNYNSHFWNELPALTSYIEKCQSVLQHSRSDNDILLYFPVHEVWKNQNTEGIIRLFDVHRPKAWLFDTAFGNLAQVLWDRGFTFDFISDRMISDLNVKEGLLVSGKTTYKAVVIPFIERIPFETLSLLNDLAKNGATVIFEKEIPGDIPGLFDLENQKNAVISLKNEMLRHSPEIRITTDITETLEDVGIIAEEMAEKGLGFIRKRTGDTTIYFVANLSDKFSEDWVKLNTKAETIEMMDPLSGQVGTGISHRREAGSEVYLQLQPGQSCIFRCIPGKTDTPAWMYLKTGEGNEMKIKGDWLLNPVQGAPEIPSPATLQSLQSWTDINDQYEAFSGKVNYSNTFEVPVESLSADGFLLDLGNVRETARVKINDRDLGLVWCLPFKLLIPKGIIMEKNRIEIEVTNLSVNRIIKMDKDGYSWKNFHEINLVDIRYQPYDASGMQPEDSGLLGPVKLIPCRFLTLNEECTPKSVFDP